jgi:hypothetical protein
MWEEIRMDRTTKWIGGDTSNQLYVITDSVGED